MMAGSGAPASRRMGHFPQENVNAFAPITTFSFLQKKPKSLPPDAFYGLKIYSEKTATFVFLHNS